MNKQFFLYGFLTMILFMPAFSQDKELMSKHEGTLKSLFVKVFNEPTDNERYNANEQAVQLLVDALDNHKSFNWQWNSLRDMISILEPKDKKFKIFTWAIVRDNGEYECFGLMQVENEKTNEYDVVMLVDKANSIMNPEEATLSSNSWYGVVYYDLITSKYEDKTYYTLLGWTGNSPVFQRKVIEVVSFKSFSTDPVFGQKIFYRMQQRKNVDKDKRRIIFEYSKNANLTLEYGKQNYVESQKIRKSPKTPPKVVETNFKHDMIVFDELEPPIDGLSNLPQYNVPSEGLNGYSFEKNRWVMKKDIFPRHSKNKTLDNPQQYRKTKPAYEVPRNYE